MNTKITPSVIEVKNLLLFILFFGFGFVVEAQVVNDYRTVASGNWNTVAVWERYSGTAWQAATVAPTRTVNTITIRNGHTLNVSAGVTADQLTVESNAVLTLAATLTIYNGTGTDFLLSGKLVHNASGRFSFNSTAATFVVASTGNYQYNRSFTATVGLPTGAQTTWNSGSVCSVTNDIAVSTFFTGHQFSTLEIDYATGTAVRSIEPNWGSIGTLKIKNTGTTGIFAVSNTAGTTNLSVGTLEVSGGRMHAFATASSGSKTFTVTGNVLQSGGVLSVCSNNAAGTYLMQVNGSYTLTGGTTNISNATGTSARIADLNVLGPVVVSTGTLQLATGGSTVTNDGRLFLGDDFTLLSGTLAFNQARTTGVSGVYFSGAGSVTFTWSGGTLNTGNGGVGRRFYTSTSSGLTGVSEIYNGTSAQTTIDGSQGTPSSGYIAWPSSGALLQNLTIQNTAGVVLRSSKVVNGTLQLISGIFTLGNSNLTLTNSNGLVGGSSVNYIATSGTGNFIRTVSGSGTYFYPVGSVTAYNGATFTWSSTPGISQLSGRYVATSVTVGTGLPLTSGCFTATDLLDNGYWTFTATGTLANSPQFSFVRNGHTNAGLTLSNHALLRRATAGSDWQMAGTWADSGSGMISPANIGTVALSQNDGTGFGQFALGKGTVSNLVASVTVSTMPSGAVCPGTTVSFTATPTNGGTIPTYQWFLNGVAISGETAAAYSSSALMDSDEVTVQMTSNHPCVGTSVVTSSGVTITYLTNKWMGTTNAYWNEPTNWSCGTVPTGSGSILIDTNSPNIPLLNIDLTVGSNSVFTLSGSGQLIIHPQHTLRILGTAHFNNRPVFMQSNASGTAMLGTVSGTLTGATNVTVERYIPLGKRAFRFLASSVHSTGTISTTWQMNTHITGAGGATNGFDATTTNSPSLYLYANQVPSGTGWFAATNTNASSLEVGKGYRILIRGDRTPELLTTASTENMNAPITLNATGALVTGDFEFNASSSVPINNTTNTTTDNGSLIGNPYQSAVDWHTVTKSGMQDVYYAWDANMGSATERGRYVAYSQSTGTSNEPSSAVSRYIQPGQAFFVKNQTSGVAGSLRFKETDKHSVNTAVFKAAPTTSAEVSSTLSVSLYESSTLSSGGYPLDGTVAVFGASFSDAVDAYDVKKLEAPGENLAWYQSDSKLAISSQGIPQQSSVCELKALRLKATKNYSFKVIANGFDSGLTATLVDSYTGIQTPINLNGVTTVSFATTSAMASLDENRFVVLFNEALLGGEEITAAAVTVYPNPIQGNTFSLLLPSSVQEPVHVALYSLLGQLLYEKDYTPQSLLKISPNVVLQKGVYMVEIHIGATKIKKKIVVE